MIEEEFYDLDPEYSAERSAPIGIGIDLGGTNIKGIAFDLELGDVLAKSALPTRDGEMIDDTPAFAIGVDELIGRLEDEIETEADFVGLSAPGLAGKKHSAIRFMPGRLEGLENLNWAKFLGRARVPVVNDAHAALLGEVWQGAARGVDDVFMLTLGTGVGGAIYANGRLLTGNIGRAGHLGHISLNPKGPGDICGTPGSLEDLVGDCTILQRTNGKYDSTQALVEAAATGEAEAYAWWNEVILNLAAGITGLINVLDPEMIIIGGGIANADVDLFVPLEEKLASFEWRPKDHRVKIKTAELGEWAGCYGAVQFAVA